MLSQLLKTIMLNQNINTKFKIQVLYKKNINDGSLNNKIINIPSFNIAIVANPNHQNTQCLNKSPTKHNGDYFELII